LQEWLQIIEKKPGDERNKEAMVAVFLLLGREDELVTSYQRKLYQALH
jgi:thioredoxin-like negative regulator of GroEL